MTLAHDDDRQGEPGKDEELKRTGQFRHLRRVEERQEGDDRCHGKRRRHRRTAPSSQGGKDSRKQVVTTHGQRVTGRT